MGQNTKRSIQKKFSLSPYTVLKSSRIGSVLFKQGAISQSQLKEALVLQKSNSLSFGQTVLKHNMISRGQLYHALGTQAYTRVAATVLLTALSFASFGVKKTEAASISDVPAKIKVAFNSGANPYGDLYTHRAVFGTSEKKSENIKPFTKWRDMFAKFDGELQRGNSNALVKEFQGALKRYEGLELKDMATKVNNFVNQKRYITDSRNYGTSDYWATPIEFLKRGGDCEDFAIAKYVALRALGVPESRLRVAIVQDTVKNVPHAVLMVYTDRGTYVLDNQIKTLVDTKTAGRYRPIYSINRTAWWLHTAPTSGTQIALR